MMTKTTAPARRRVNVSLSLKSMLVSRFGDQYREYMGKTGRFLPKL